MGYSSGYLTTTASGNVASFTTRSAVPIRSLKAHFLPVQTGTGDPAPDNVRPITGWTGLDVTKCGKNILNPFTNPLWNNGIYTVNQNGSITQSGSDGRGWTSDKFAGLPLKKGQYTLSFTESVTCNLRTSIDDYTENFRTATGVLTFSLPEDCAVKWKVSLGTGNTVTYNTQLEVGSTPTPYTPYTGSTIPVDWTTEAGTVYGGYVDLVTGEVVKTYASCSLSYESWSYNSTYNFLSVQNWVIPDNAAWTNLASGELSPVICEAYKTTNIIITSSEYASLPDKSIHIFKNSNKYALRIMDSRYTDPEVFINAMGNTKIIYPLATPVTVATLTSQQINALKGANNIWNSANDVTSVDYDLQENFDIQTRKKFIMNNTPHIVTTTPAGIATFSTDMVSKLKSARFNFLPVQAGSGDPSPTNVRAISGWTGLNVYKTGKNLLPSTLPANKIYGTLNGDTITSAGSAIIFAIPCSQNTNYCCSQDTNNKKNWGIAFSNKLPEVGDTVSGKGNMTYRSIFNVESESYAYLLVGIPNISVFTDIQSNNSMIEVGNTNTAYAPTADLITIPIDWTTEAGTIYGGYVDIVRGVVVATMAIFDLATTVTNVQTFSTIKAWYSNSLSTLGIAEIASGDASFVGYCDTYSFMSYGTMVNNYTGNNAISVRSDNNRKAIYILTDRTDEVAPTGHAILQLATPITYTIDPVTLKSLRGINNVWSSANGNATITYWTH